MLEYFLPVKILCINEEESRFLTRIAPDLFFLPVPVLSITVLGEDFLTLRLLTERLKDSKDLESMEPLEMSFRTLLLFLIPLVPTVLDNFLVLDIAEAEGA